MKMVKVFLPVLVFAGILASGSASAQHHSHSHTSVGVAIGVPGPYYAAPYPYPYYYPYPYGYPPVVTVRPSPPVYVERSQDEVEGEYYWYYCTNPQGYYPYIKECRTNWQRVTPVPQGN